MAAVEEEIVHDDLIDYDWDENQAAAEKKENEVEVGRGNYAAIHPSGFRDFFLKPELLRVIGDAGFEHPSEVQHETIPHAITGVDILCQAKSGMGKTAVFVLSILHQLLSELSGTSYGNNEDGNPATVGSVNGTAGDAGNTAGTGSSSGVICLGLAHTRELAFQIKNEFDRFSKYIKGIRCEVVYGGVPIQANIEMLKNPKSCPHILVGTPGRVLALIRDKHLSTNKIAHFVLDECDKCLEKLDMRRDVQAIFTATPKKKQVMFFSATMGPDAIALCRKFMKFPVEIIIDETKLTLHGLLQYYIKLQEASKNRKLNDLLDKLDFNQVIIFVKSVGRAEALDKLLVECSFPSITIHGGLPQEERIQRYQEFKAYKKRVLVATDLFGRGIDIERVNIVINYDMPESSDAYLHRVGRAGRFGTKGLALTFVSSQEETKILNQVQERFEVQISEMPEQIDRSLYINQ